VVLSMWRWRRIYQEQAGAKSGDIKLRWSRDTSASRARQATTDIWRTQAAFWSLLAAGNGQRMDRLGSDGSAAAHGVVVGSGVPGR